jgi:hypothetical protein
LILGSSDGAGADRDVVIVVQAGQIENSYNIEMVQLIERDGQTVINGEIPGALGRTSNGYYT